MNKVLLCAALAGIISVGVASVAHAGDAMTDSKVKCFGIAKAGKNSCKAVNGSHSCAGQSKVDNDPNEFTVVGSDAACTGAGGTVGAPAAK